MKKTLSIAAFALLAGASIASAADVSTYNVTFDVNWTTQSHPLDYPDNAHFSGLIGATHNKDYSLFADGNTATDGLEALTEKGSHSPLDNEVRQAIKTGTAGTLFESDPLFKFPGKLSAKFTATAKHPYVTVAAMIAPSPDWFAGVSKVSLKRDGEWVEKTTMPLFAWDAGTDLGTTYQAKDADAQPRQSVRMNVSAHFMGAQGVRQVGTVTFTRIADAIN